ncbi:MAG TPA: sugar ABC transporter substrate-binding protein [Thermodesulfobacteriota bacterium]|nr:sugar ABC transporter substrate-binding protein [Thermodesulfobacteriota bacterium]
MASRQPIIFILLLIIIVITLSKAHAGDQKPKELTIIWHSGDLSEYLIEISKQYTKQTGVKINVELVPWDKWHDTIASEFDSKGSRFDLVVFDSQSMSEFASEGNFVLLNPYIEKSKKVKFTDYDPEALREYAEYPEGSGKLYALPLNQDAMGLVYRKDLLEDPEEKKAFKVKYGYELTVPETYEQLKDIAEFFNRPVKNLYGIALYGSRDYDAVTTAFNNVLWSFGGELWDPRTRRAEGFINSSASVAALEYFKELFKYAPPGATGWYYDEVNNAINNGRVAMGINWYYFFNANSNPKISKYADKLGFAPLPGEKGPDGKFRQYNSLGGQGISISKFSKHVDEAWRFLEWFVSNENQWEWVKGGGQTGRVDILRSPSYANATPYNSVFPVSMSRVKDYWHLVEYPQLLDIYQKYVNLAITGAMSPKEALDNVAKEQQAVLDKAS